MFPKNVQVNTRNIRLAIEEGMRPMTEFFDPRYDMIPFFSNEMMGENWGNGHHPSFSMAHVPGRWLNALLNAENVTGKEVPCEVIENLRKWAYNAIELTGIRFPGCIDTATMETVKESDLHNLREQMHALYALYKYRGDEKAKQMALDLIDAVDEFFDDETGGLKEEAYFEATGGKPQKWPGMNPIYPFPLTFGRYIGPLVKFYKASGEAKALRQAIRLKDCCFDLIMNEDGEYNAWVYGSHTHSTTAMLSSLAQLYEVTRDEETLQRILAFMDNGLKHIALDFGWCIENYNRNDNVGEINNTSDIMETCLILGKCGIPDAYARAERILRTHFLPAQLLDVCFIPEDIDPEHVTRYHMPERAKGSFGFPCPFGHEDHPGAGISFNWDIVGGGVGGLCEAMREQITCENRLVSVNLLFDGEREYASFESPYDRNDTAKLTLKQDNISARIRIPGGANDWNVTGAESFEEGEWLYIVGAKKDVPVEIEFDFADLTESYPFRHREYVFRTHGEEVTGCVSEGKRLCYFPEI